MSYSYLIPDYLAILAMRDEIIQPLALRTGMGLGEVRSKVQAHWPEASIIYVNWHGLEARTKLTEQNCHVTLSLLKQRNGFAILVVSSREDATKGNADFSARELGARA